MPDENDLPITVLDILAANDRLNGHIHNTPIMTSETINQLAQCQVFFKCEHLQKTGSFKARGACNAVMKMKEEGKVDGVVTHSSGNHGQGLSWAASLIDLPCCVVVPNTAPSSKIEGMEAYGATIEYCEPTMKSREETCEKVGKEKNYTFVPPFDDAVIMAGQGTIAVELLTQLPSLDAVFVAVGGGGLASGTIVYLKETKQDVQVFLVQPEGKQLETYLNDGQCRSDVDSLTTIADGIRVLRVGSNPLPILKKYCKDTIISVTEDEIKEAVKLIWTRLKQRVEPTAGVPLAGLLKMVRNGDHFPLKNKKVAIILCGGNCDVDFVPL